MGKINRIKIRAVGDILLADGYFDIGYGIGSYLKRNGLANHVAELEKLLLDDCDLLLGNLECTIARETKLRGLRSREFLGDPRFVKRFFEHFSFNALLVANNHVGQHGERAYIKTLHFLKSMGIWPIGAKIFGDNLFKILEIKGKKIGICGFSMVEDEHNKDPYFYARDLDGREVLEAVKKIKKKCDVLILMLHWGWEFMDFPHIEQMKFAHKLIDEGADIVLGSHPHVLQPVEIYQKKIIAYSLGNFVFNMPWEKTKRTGVLEIICEENGGRIEYHPKFIPAYIHDYGFPKTSDDNFCGSNSFFLTGHDIQDIFISRFGSNDSYLQQYVKNMKILRKKRVNEFIKNIHRMEIKWIPQIIYEALKRRLSFLLKSE